MTERAIVLAEVEGPWRIRMRRMKEPAGLPSVVADGVVFRDGVVILRWRGKVASTSYYPTLAGLRAVHEHDGTTFEWVDQEPTEAFVRGSTDAYQDSCENCPCASIGGLDKRAAPEVPKYIPDVDRAEWLRGYERTCHAMWGEDWRTCSFGWSKALVIG